MSFYFESLPTCDNIPEGFLKYVNEMCRAKYYYDPEGSCSEYIDRLDEFFQSTDMKRVFETTPEGFLEYVTYVTQHCDYIDLIEDVPGGYSVFLEYERATSYFELGFIYSDYPNKETIHPLIDSYKLPYTLLLNSSITGSKNRSLNIADLPNTVIAYFPPWGKGTELKKQICKDVRMYFLRKEIEFWFSPEMFYLPPQPKNEIVSSSIPRYFRKWFHRGGPGYVDGLERFTGY